MDRVFVSFSGILARKEFDEQLKHLFLWFDEVIFDQIGSFDRNKLLENRVNLAGMKSLDRTLVRETFIPVREAVSLDWDRRFHESLGRGYPRWGENEEKYHYPDPQSPYELAHNALLQKIEVEKGVPTFINGYEIQQAEGRARFAVDSVSLWREVTSQLPCVFNATPDEEVALNAFRLTHPHPVQISPSEILSGSLPNLSLLSWDEILKVKRSDSLTALKKRAKEALEASSGNLSNARMAFANAEREICNEIIDRSRPRPGKALAEGILGNLPMGIINPFSIAFSWRTLAQQSAADEEYSWVYLLRDIRSTIAKAERDLP